jgi:hypothetical protein
VKLLIRYAWLLKMHGTPDAPEVRAFAEKHKGDAVLSQRMRTLNGAKLLHLALSDPGLDAPGEGKPPPA